MQVLATLLRPYSQWTCWGCHKVLIEANRLATPSPRYGMIGSRSWLSRLAISSSVLFLYLLSRPSSSDNNVREIIYRGALEDLGRLVGESHIRRGGREASGAEAGLSDRAVDDGVLSTIFLGMFITFPHPLTQYWIRVQDRANIGMMFIAQIPNTLSDCWIIVQEMRELLVFNEILISQIDSSKSQLP